MQVNTRKAGPVTILDVSGEIDFAVGCLDGLSTRAGAEEVGRSTKRAVVTWWCWWIRSSPPCFDAKTGATVLSSNYANDEPVT